MFGLFRAWRRRRLARAPLPPAWLEYLERHVPFFGQLQPPLRERFLRLLKIFIAEKHFIAAGGMEMSEEVRVVIGAIAVRLILHLHPRYYDRLTEIVVYPSHLRQPGADGIVFGAAHGPGTVVLSWEAVLHGLQNPKDGHDTTTHEFAHILDRADGGL
jgi:Mlc titration factor MtfA (ptsG expression regulator)